ncbi:MAG: hypothetical protein QG663_1691 [Thermodesulfobacteriota bacterium]|nr:hypothetical protein [Thermodesulfobacteriota bacterium]
MNRLRSQLLKAFQKGHAEGLSIGGIIDELT